ncbi:MAG: aminoacyl-tRNA hydrolase [Holophagaceae bacterium]|nr:aminoacyl-tRNA hydrolase [Holophagaceae bacterium]
MWFQFWKKKQTPTVLQPGRCVIVPLGNPGDEYALTRHNLGRLMVQRWMDGQSLTPEVLHSFIYGTLYSLNQPFVALVPSTYMNMSGRVVAEMVRGGFSLERMAVIYDDKDLPLGAGRLSNGGGSGGHNGLQSVMDEFGTDNFVRIRLGIGPFVRPLHDWVLGEWTQEELELIEGMDAPFAKLMSSMAADQPFAVLQSQVNNPAFWQKKQLAERSF